MKKHLFASCVACVGLLFAGEGDTEWKETADGNLDAEGNWSAGLPSSTVGEAKFNVNFAADLTLGSQTLLTAFNIRFSSAAGRSWTLDLGEGNTFLSKNKIFLDNISVTLKSGTFGTDPAIAGERILIGDTVAGSTLTVDGPAAKLVTSKSNALVLGQNKGDNTLVVRNGGTFCGGIVTGINGTNTVLVAGAGSTMEIPSTNARSIQFGANTTESANFDTILFDDGAKFLYNYSGNDLFVGGYYSGDWGGRARMTFANGSTFDASGSTKTVIVGNYTSSNELNIVSGSTFEAHTLMVGGDAWTKPGYKNAGRLARDNVFRVSGVGSSAKVTDFVLGAGTGSAYGQIRVEDGATFETAAENQSIFRGNTLLGNEFFVGTNAFARIPGHVFINPLAGSLSNGVTVCGGTLLVDCSALGAQRQVTVGRYGDGAYLNVADNGRFVATNYMFGISMEAFASNGVVRLVNGGMLDLTDSPVRMNSVAGATGASILMDGGILSVRNPTATQEFIVGRSGTGPATLALDHGSRGVLSNVSFSVASGNGASNVVVRVSDASSLRIEDSAVLIGNGTSSQDVSFRVDASTVEVSNVGGHKDFVVGNVTEGAGARMTLDHGADVSLSNVTFVVGNGLASRNAALVIRNGSTLRILSEPEETNDMYVYYIGKNGPNARLELDGGTFLLPKARLIFGGASGSSLETAKITNGSRLEAYRLIMGCNNGAVSNVLEIADSELVLGNALESSYEGLDDVHDLIYVHGSNTSITAGSVSLRKDATLKVEIPKEGLCRPMFNVSKFGWTKTSAGAFERTRGTFKIAVAEGCEPGTHVIVSSTADLDYGTMPDIEFSAPPGCKLITDKRLIAVKVPKGMTLIVR